MYTVASNELHSMHGASITLPAVDKGAVEAYTCTADTHLRGGGPRPSPWLA